MNHKITHYQLQVHENNTEQIKSIDSMASKLQEHGRFKKCEAKFERRCEQTKGKVEYKGPSPDEASLTATNKRRRRMKRKLTPHMSEEEKRRAALRDCPVLVQKQ